jgi:hypothetical protein
MELPDAMEKIPSDTTGFDPRMFRLVAQCLNQYATPGPSLLEGDTLILLKFWTSWSIIKEFSPAEWEVYQTLTVHIQTKQTYTWVYKCKNNLWLFTNLNH